MLRIVKCGALGMLLGLANWAGAQQDHQHHEAAATKAKAPKLFLDKSPKVIEYQLKRLSNEELLLAERNSDDAKYIPVHAAILSRAAMPANDRHQAAEALAKLKSTSVVKELLTALEALPEDSAESSRTARDLTAALFSEPAKSLSSQTEALTGSLTSPSGIVRRAAAGTLLLIGNLTAVRQHAQKSPEAALDMLTAVGLLNSETTRNSVRGDVIAMLEASQPVKVKQQAIRALAAITADGQDKFTRLMALYAQPDLREEVVRAMLTVPADQRDTKLASELSNQLITWAEATPIDARTSDPFIDAAQLAESLLPSLPAEPSRALRKRWQTISVRVVRIKTVEEEMRYDIKYFAVEAGRPVEIVLQNADLMPHNLVITQAGALKEIAMLAAKMPPDQAPKGKQYVPEDERVLFATSMVPAGKQERLSFEAPAAAGEYPFVCTFPNHWMRMYGVMVVVPDLDAWQKNPKAPADPIGNNRSFVRKWTLPDLEADVETGVRGRTAEIGARLLKEATCLQCHKLRGEGGIVGPELSEVAQRFKRDKLAILQEIIDPSHKIEPKYAVQQSSPAKARFTAALSLRIPRKACRSSPAPTSPRPSRSLEMKSMRSSNHRSPSCPLVYWINTPRMRSSKSWLCWSISPKPAGASPGYPNCPQGK